MKNKYFYFHLLILPTLEKHKFHSSEARQKYINKHNVKTGQGWETFKDKTEQFNKYTFNVV